MDETLNQVYELCHALFFLGFKYGLMAVTWFSNLVTSKNDDDAWVAKIIITLLVVFATYKTLQMVFRGIMFWIKLAFNISLIIGGVAIVAWVYDRGIEGVYRDLEFLVKFWTQQYYKYQKQAKVGMTIHDAVNRVRGEFLDQRQPPAGRRW